MTKHKVIPVQAVKAYRDRRGRSPLILDQVSRWERVIIPSSCCFNPGKRTHGTHSTARRF